MSVRRRKRRNTRRRRGDGTRRALRWILALGLLAGILALARIEATRDGARMTLIPRSWPSTPVWSMPVWVDWRTPLRGPVFRVRDVSLRGLRKLDPSQIRTELALPEQVALIDVDPEGLCARLAQRVPRLAECEIDRVPPGTLRVRLRERTPVGAFEGGDGVDADGARFPLLAGEAAGLPRLSGDAAKLLPYLESARIAGVALEAAAARGGRRAHVELQPATVRVRVLAGDDPLETLLRYRAIAESGVLERLSARELDLRFRGRAFLRDFAPPDRGVEGRGA
jgi:hypothetical protein